MQSMIKISVRNLVEFVMRSGDLTAAFSGRSRALAGTKAHKQVQKAQPGYYRPEAPLSHTIDAGDFLLEIGGRADGIVEQDGIVLIDEIKSTDLPLDVIGEQDNPHYWAQAKCYAYIYATQHNLESINVQLTYYQLAEKTCKRFEHTYSQAELAAFFADLINRYLHWARLIRQFQSERDASVKQLQFPFGSFRPGQRDLAVAVYRSICARQRLYAQAPTGIGKTLAVLFPAIKAIGEGKTEKIFYLTAKTSTQEVAETALAVLRERGLRLKSLILTAKEKICFNPGAECDPANCEYARGHYDRIHNALADIYSQSTFSRAAIEQCARTHQVCPFELSLDLTLWADCVICDYNYCFDPRVSLKRIFDENTIQYCLLIDEAHNLTDRAREMFSAAIAKKQLAELKQLLKSTQPNLARALAGIITKINAWGKLCQQSQAGQHVQSQLPEEVITPMYKFLRAADAWLALNQPAPYRQELLQAYFALHAFVRTAEDYAENYVFYAQKLDGDITGKLFCVDPSPLLRRQTAQNRAVVFFSATLSPLEFYKDTLGGEPSDACLTVDSPFPKHNLCVLAADDIATTYNARADSFAVVADSVKALTATRSGNYLVFFPSYRYLDEVAQRFCCDHNTQLIKQSPGMSDAEREAFLARFSVEPNGTLVGFAVLGGAFGEGIDLSGERLCGAIIVGIGLPQIGLERNIIRCYYQDRNSMGFEYAYLYPGLNKVMQAAGRVIRSDNDKGIVLLVDERYDQLRCRRLLPSWWQPIKPVRGCAAIQSASRQFWFAQASTC